MAENFDLPKLISDFRELILVKLQKNCSEEACKYLIDSKKTNLPFDDNFLENPDQIIIIKNLINTLYYAEQTLKSLESLNSKTNVEFAKSVFYDLYNIRPNFLALQNQAFEVSHALANLSIEYLDLFKPELTQLSSIFSFAISNTYDNAKQFQLDKNNEQSTSLILGKFIGSTIEKMRPAATGELNVDLLAHFGVTLPQHIESMRSVIETYSGSGLDHYTQQTKMIISVQKREKLEHLLRKTNILYTTLVHDRNNIFSFAVDIISIVVVQVPTFLYSLKEVSSQIQVILKETNHLDEALQSLIREYLASLKYQYLPMILSLADKIEVELMVKPENLSNPLKEPIKQYYDMLVQYLKLVVNFPKKGEKLLKLEDERFIELRIEPLRESLIKSKEILAITDNALNNLNNFEALTLNIEVLMPFFEKLDNRYNHLVDKKRWNNSGNTTCNAKLFHELVQNNKIKENPIKDILKSYLTQIKNDQQFKINIHEQKIESIYSSSGIVVFPYTSYHHAFDIRDENPSKPNDTDFRHLYRWYQNQKMSLEAAEINCDHLIQALQTDPSILDLNTSEYQLNILTKESEPKEKCINIKIENSILRYEIIHLEEVGCKLFLKSVDYVKSSGARNCYVWEEDASQLAYIDDDGLIERNINLSNKNKIDKFIATNKFKRLRKSNRDSNDEFKLTPELIFDLISSNGGHRLKSKTGTIVLGELDPQLRVVSTLEQLEPYRARIVSILLERGHVNDKKKSNLLRWYSSIQPYYIDAFKSDNQFNVVLFDQKMVSFLSGQPKTEKIIKQQKNQFKYHLLLLKNHFVMINDKINHELIRIEDKLNQVSYHPVFSLPQMIHHQEFLPDVVEFMGNLQLVNDEINESQKTLKKVDMALYHFREHIKLNDNQWLKNTNKDDIHYAYFQPYLLQLKSKIQKEPTVLDIERYLEEIKSYELSQVKYNQWLIESAHNRDGIPLNVNKPYDSSEKTALMRYIRAFDMILVKDDLSFTTNKIAIHIKDNVLEYSLIYFGQEVQEKMPFTMPDEKINKVLSYKDKERILSSIVNYRIKQITDNKSSLMPDEALYFYQWYVSMEQEFSNTQKRYREWCACLNSDDKAKQPTIKKELALIYPILQPLFKVALVNDESNGDIFNEFSPAFEYFNDNLNQAKKNIREFITIENQKLQTKKEFYLEYAEKLPAKILEKSIEPVAKRTTYLVKHQEYSKLINQFKTEFNRYVTVLNATFRQQLNVKENQLLYPDLDSQEKVLKQAQQIVPLKKIKNLIFYLETSVAELENLQDQSNIDYFWHVWKFYQNSDQIIRIYYDIKSDPYLSIILKDITQHYFQIYNGYFDELKLYHGDYSVEIEDGKRHFSIMHNDTPSILFTPVKVIDIFPERISLKDEEFNSKYIDLKSSADASVKKTIDLLSHYNPDQIILSAMKLIFRTSNIMALERDFRNKLTLFFDKVYQATSKELTNIDENYFNFLLIYADNWERKLGLTGLISEHIRPITEKIYQGMVSTLGLDIDARTKLLINTNQIDIRIDRVNLQILKQGRLVQDYLSAFNSLDILMKKSSNILYYHNWDYLNLWSNDSVKKIEQDLVVTLPFIKRALNGSECYLVSYSEAQRLKLKDCFVWNEEYEKFYYLDTNGNSKHQFRLSLMLQSIDPEGSIPKKPRSNCPTVYKRGKDYYVLENFLGDDGGWKLSQLDSSVIEKANLSFKHLLWKELRFHKKHTALYEELIKKTNYSSLYKELTKKSNDSSISLNKPEEFKQFIKKKINDRLAIPDNTLVIKNPIPSIYLSENEVKHHITSKNNLIIDKFGVSSLNMENTLGDLNHFMVNFKTLEQLQPILSSCKDYYQGLHETSLVDINSAREQLKSLKEIKDKKIIENETSKKAMWETEFKEKATLTAISHPSLQSYQLVLLKANSKIKPNQLYLNILKDKLEYKVVDPFGQIKKGNISCSDIGCSLERLDNIQQIEPFLSKILLKTADEKHTYRYSAPYDYQKSLKEDLFATFDEFYINNNAPTAQLLTKFIELKADKFNESKLNDYRTLFEIQKAISEFELFLEQEKLGYKQGYFTWFENENTVNEKIAILKMLYKESTDSGYSVAERIQRIQTELVNQKNIDYLYNRDQYEPKGLAKLFKCILVLLESVGLYTIKASKYASHLEKVVKPAELNKRNIGFFNTESTDQSTESTDQATDGSSEQSSPRPPG